MTWVSASMTAMVMHLLLVPPLRAFFLRSLRDWIDDRIDQPVSPALDLRDVDGSDPLLVPIEADRAARWLDLIHDGQQDHPDRVPVSHFFLYRIDPRTDHLGPR